MKIEGIYCALVTPLTDGEEIDAESAVKLTRHVVNGGVNGILALGSTGEQIALDAESKAEMVKAVCSAMPKDMPLIVGCGATSTKLAIRNIVEAEKAGADAVILTAPCFYPPKEDGMVRYFTEAADASDVPLYLYNISRFVGSTITADTVKRLISHPNICGIKESDRDEGLVQQLLELRERYKPDFAVIQGSERIFAKSFDWGCPAGVTVVGNLDPEPAVSLWKAWKAGDREKLALVQKKALDYVRVITMLGLFPLELKYLCSEKGLCGDRMTSPFPRLSEEQKKQLHIALEELEKQYQN